MKKENRKTTDRDDTLFFKRVADMLVREEEQSDTREDSTETTQDVCDRLAKKMLYLDLFDIVLELEKSVPNCCLKWYAK